MSSLQQSLMFERDGQIANGFDGDGGEAKITAIAPWFGGKRTMAAEIVEELDRTDPIEPDGARYECCICRDDGRVSVLLPEYVAGVAAEVIDPWLDVQTADCRCVCRRGMGGPSEAGAGAELLRDAVIVEMRFYRVRPKSHYRSGKNSHLLKPGAPPVPTHKPDVLKAMPATRKGSGGQRMLFATKGGA